MVGKMFSPPVDAKAANMMAALLTGSARDLVRHCLRSARYTVTAICRPVLILTPSTRIPLA